MGHRRLAHIQFDVSLLYPDQATFEAFSQAVMQRMQSSVDFEEQEFHSRGIEVCQADNLVEFDTDG